MRRLRGRRLSELGGDLGQSDVDKEARRGGDAVSGERMKTKLPSLRVSPWDPTLLQAGYPGASVPASLPLPLLLSASLPFSESGRFLLCQYVWSWKLLSI